MTRLNQSKPITVVTQVINDLEAQGLLMLFDRQDQVAQRLTGDLMAAGVLADNTVQPSPILPQASEEPFDA